MAANRSSDVIQQLRRVVLFQGEGGLTDGQLLEEFIRRREPAALAALVHRHGPMVWGVCARVLGNNHEAEDAFQSTFLVFVRKAASVAPKEMIGNWLYGVARQTALNARAAVARRRKKERIVNDLPEAPLDESWRDLLPHLDRELGCLPDKYRAAIVLCDLEGKTRREAAHHLGLPEGTLASQLARARTMLAKRMARHGAGLSGGALAAVLSQNVASASVPPPVVSATIQAVVSVAAGQATTGLVSAKVAALTEGVVKTMFLKQLKAVTAVLFVVGTFVAVGGGLLITRDSGAAQQDEKPNVKKAATPPGDPPKDGSKQARAKDDPASDADPKGDKVTIRGRVLDADGKGQPITEGILLCRSYLEDDQIWNGTHTKRVTGGQFSLPGCDLEGTSEVFFVDEKNRWGTVAKLMGQDAGKPIVVRLESCGSAKLRIVDEKGKPIVNRDAMVQFIITPGVDFFSTEADSIDPKTGMAPHPAEMALAPYATCRGDTDADGRITFHCLIPGATYRVGGYLGQLEDAKRLQRGFRVEPGQALDLGEIRVPAKK